MSKYYTHPTGDEWALIATHPIDTVRVAFASITASNETDRRFPGDRPYNNMADAFKHCYFAAILSRDLGYYTAIRYLDTHENYPGNPSREKRMDDYNNRAGAALGSTQKSDAALAEVCYGMAMRGELVDFP